MKRYVLSIFEHGKARFYGTGDFDYMKELIEDYVVTKGIYGKENVDFRIEPIEVYYLKMKQGKLEG